jgi:hypothetical protein
MKYIKLLEDFETEFNDDVIRFDAGDELKLTDLARSLGHSYVDFTNPEICRRALKEGPVYVIGSRYYYHPAGNIVLDGTTNKSIPVRISFEDTDNISGIDPSFLGILDLLTILEEVDRSLYNEFVKFLS